VPTHINHRDNDLANQKAGAKKITKALHRTPSATTVKAAYACVGCVAQHEGAIEGELNGFLF
jgi:inosine/xanthosine triphosphate pyrophosphatase family protein